MTTDPDLSGEQGWLPITIPGLINEQSFVSGEPDGDRLRLIYYHDGGGHLVAKVWFGPGAQGPPGHAHGGSQAAVLDEAMGTCAWMNGHAVLAGELTTRFRKMLPLGTTCIADAHVHKVDGRKIRVHCTLKGPQGELFSEGEGTFIVLPPETWDGAAHKAAAHFKAQTEAARPLPGGAPA